jgi:MFS family permease
MSARDSRDVALLLGAVGLNSLPYGYTLVVLPIYLSDIGFSGQVIGAVSSASSIAATVALIPFAIAADRYGRKPFVLAGFLLSTVAYLIFAFTRDLNLLLFASALGGVGLAGGFSSAVYTPAWTALLAEKAHDKRTSAFAWSQGLWALALTVGSAMSVIPFFLRTNWNVSFGTSYEYAFLILAGFAIVSGVLIFPVTEVRPKPLQQTEASSKQRLRLASKRQITKFSVSFGMVGLASGLTVQLLSLWFYKMYGTSDTTLGPWFAGAEVTSIVVVPAIPILTGKLGSIKSAVWTQGISSVLLAVMILAPTYQLAGTLFIIRNFFMNISWPIQQSYLMGTVTPEERASASAITYTAWGVGNSIGPLIAGYLLSGASYASISAPIVVGGGLYLVSAVGFYEFFRNIAPPEEAAVMRRERYGVVRSGLK